RGSVDLYSRTTKDLFDSARISPITGQTKLLGNSPIEVYNKGIEVAFAYDLFKTEDLKFTLRGNYSYNYNEVDKIPDGFRDDGNITTRNGGKVYEFYLVPYAGVNPETGNLLFVAQDGSLTETPNLDTDRRATGK